MKKSALTSDALFHPLDVGNKALPTQFTCPFCYIPDELALQAKDEVVDHLKTKTEWHAELSQGKMFGVLVVKNAEGEVGFLAAFSGNLNGTNRHEYFVPPIFDFQQKGGTYKTEEAEIENINANIDKLESLPYVVELQAEIGRMKSEQQAEIASRKAELKKRKRLRDELRKFDLSAEETAKLVKASQFEKAELKRCERMWQERIASREQELALFTQKIDTLKAERQHRSQRLQRWLFARFRVQNALGERRSMNDIFRHTASKVPPSGAGECCAPKLLNYAYANGFTPISMGEFWWGESPKGEVRRHMNFYPACHSKCEPILGFMLQGLDVQPDAERSRWENRKLRVIYEDQWLIAVDKPSGLCSVPGRETRDSCIELLRREYPSDTFLEVVHRLDMSTSGILLVARDADSHRLMLMLDASREGKKKYIALLDVRLANTSGTIDLPMRPNLDDRPRQMVDRQDGLEARTTFKVIGHEGDRTRVAFYPETGRTHQLRLHAAHLDGLATPILGDNLYGKAHSRLHLHASELTFCHPYTKQIVHLISPSPF